MREIILKAAHELTEKEGLDGISIRKIADMIEYSPAIIYHYFKNKDEIIIRLLELDYQKLLSVLSVLQTGEKTPEEKLRASAYGFIQAAVQMGDSYKNMMLTSSPAVLEHTSVLKRGAAAERPAIAMLCGALRELPGFEGTSSEQTELTAQVIWSTAFGLAIRLIVEQVDEPQRNRLMEHAAEFILCALKSGQH